LGLGVDPFHQLVGREPLVAIAPTTEDTIARKTLLNGSLASSDRLAVESKIFDPEHNKRVLVDHAFIVAGGEITKAARNWLAENLDASKRSQIMFIDRNDILNLHVVTNLPLP
jgi:hypothetical protein